MRHYRTAFATLLLAGLASWPVAPSPAHAAPAGKIDPKWVHWDSKTKTASLTIIAGYNDTAGGFNFNGYNMGGLTITVPQGAKVVIAFTNRAAQVPHSAVITPFAKHSLTGNFPTAFSGSASPHADAGAANLAKPQKFSFTANKTGKYALVCGVPGHAAGGMWDVFRVAKVSQPSMTETGTSASATPTPTSEQHSGNAHLGTVEGVVTDATSGRPVVHAYVVLGWTTLKRLGETDARGHFRIANAKPVGLVDIYAFAQGYVYNHGHPISVRAGKVTTIDFKMPRQTFPDAMLPHTSGATVSPTHAKTGQKVTFTVHIKKGKNGPLSAENFAVNGALSQSVLLAHAGSDVYRGTYTIPNGVAAGKYVFTFIATMENCLENPSYPRLTLTVER